MISNPASSNQV